MSCDVNPMFIDFIPVVTRAWNKMGVKPVYGIVLENHKEHLAGIKDFGDRIEYYFPYLNDTKINYADTSRIQLYQAEMLRIWLWKQLYKNGLEGNAIFSDIDMMPLSKDYFQGTCAPYSDEHFVSYCTDAKERFGQIASCYNVASLKLVSELLEQDNWYDFAWWASDNCGPTHGADQWVMEWLLKKSGDKGISLTRGFNPANGVADRRLDRIGWDYNLGQIGNLVDAHLLRPYSQYKTEIDRIERLIP